MEDTYLRKCMGKVGERVVLATERSFTEGSHVMQYMKQATPYYCAAQQQTLPLPVSAGMERVDVAHSIRPMANVYFTFFGCRSRRCYRGAWPEFRTFFNCAPKHTTTNNLPILKFPVFYLNIQYLLLIIEWVLPCLEVTCYFLNDLNDSQDEGCSRVLPFK